MVYVCDANTYEIIFTNKKLRDSIPAPIPAGAKCWELFSPVNGPCPYCRIKEVIDDPTGKPLIWEDYNEMAKTWFQVNQSIFQWPDGRKAHLVTLLNIDKIKQGEESLKKYKNDLESLLKDKTESETMIRALGDNLPDSFVFQLKGGIHGKPDFVHISKGAEKVLGIPIEELKKDSYKFIGLFPPEGQVDVRKALAEGRKSFSREVRVDIPGRGPVWLLDSGVIRKDHDGNMVVDGLVADITKRKQMEESLHESNEDLIQMAALTKEISDNTANSAMYRSRVCEENGRTKLEYATEQLAEITGVPLEDLFKDLGGFFRNIHADDLPQVMEFEKKGSNPGYSGSVEFRYVKNGQESWYRMQSHGFVKDDCVIRDGMLIDVTDQKKLELELIAARDRARESERLKSAFLANMSHEIRTPMNVIIGFLEFMMMEDDLSQVEKREYMRLVSDNAQQLLKLIGNILDISKIDAGQMKIVPDKNNVNEMLDDIHLSLSSSFEAELSRKDMELFVDNSGQCPEGVFTVDRMRLSQVLVNLIRNAIKFTEAGYVKYGYRVLPGEGLLFFVEDTGIGISEGKLHEIGKPFLQLYDESQSAVYGGTGIGLAISKSLVELMGGWFSVNSELGKGTLFEFMVPCEELTGKSGVDIA